MQLQKQDYTQLQKQKQDLVHCNNSFGMLLSSMESLFIKSGYQISVLFGYYNHFNDITWKTKEEIRAQLYTDLMAYKIQKLAYIQKYKKFDYPDYPPINKIIDIIKKWKEVAKNKDEKSLCDEILELINDTDNKPISYYQARVESTASNSKCDPVEQVKMSNKIHNRIDKRNDQINIQVERYPKSQFGLEMNKYPGNSEFSDLYHNVDIDNKSLEMKAYEKTIANNVNNLFKKCKELFNEKYRNSYIIQEIDTLYGAIKTDFENLNLNNKNLKFLEAYCKIEDDIEEIKKFAIINKDRDRNKYNIFLEIINLFRKYFDLII